MCGFISGFSILFHSSICLFLCQYHAVLTTVALQKCPKTGRVVPPVLLFFLRIVWAVLGLLWLNIDFRKMCSSLVTNVMSNLIGITLNLYSVLGRTVILTIPLLIQSMGYLSFL